MGLSATQALWALAALMLFGLVGRVHPRYPTRGQRVALLISLYVIGLALSSGLRDPTFIRLGGFLMGGACVWLGRDWRHGSPPGASARQGR